MPVPRRAGCAAFWRLLEDGASAVTEGVPGSGAGRVGELFADAATQNDACRFGAFIDGIDQFDAAFFRISPVEAQRQYDANSAGSEHPADPAGDQVGDLVAGAGGIEPRLALLRQESGSSPYEARAP